jgi:hypothetical protein
MTDGWDELYVGAKAPTPVGARRVSRRLKAPLPRLEVGGFHLLDTAPPHHAPPTGLLDSEERFIAHKGREAMGGGPLLR